MSAPPISILKLNDSCLLEEHEKTTILFKFITHGLLINLFGFFGIIGNIISMIILSRPQMKSSINYLLIGLARVDTILIITSILLFGLTGIYPHTGYMFTYFYDIQPRMASALYFLATAGHTASAYLTVTVSFDRFVAVCNPLRARSLCTYGRARIYVLSVMVFSVIYNIPKLWESNIYSDYHPELNVTIYCVRMSDLREDVFYKAIYVTWCYFIFMHLIPFLSLLILNVCIYRQVWKANRERQRFSRGQLREIGLTKMIFCVVIVFFLSNIPSVVMNILELSKPVMTKVFVHCLNATNNFAITINSSINFLIYVTFGETFQRKFLLVFCSRCNTKTNSPETTGRYDSLKSNVNSLRLRRYNSSLNNNRTNSIRSNETLNHKISGKKNSASIVYCCSNKLKKHVSTNTSTTQTSVSVSETNSPSTTV